MGVAADFMKTFVGDGFGIDAEKDIFFDGS
jgi:hypothetical protein